MLINTKTVKDLKVGDIVYYYNNSKEPKARGYRPVVVQAINPDANFVSVTIYNNRKRTEVVITDTVCDLASLGNSDYPLVTKFDEIMKIQRRIRTLVTEDGIEPKAKDIMFSTHLLEFKHRRQHIGLIDKYIAQIQ